MSFEEAVEINDIKSQPFEYMPFQYALSIFEIFEYKGTLSTFQYLSTCPFNILRGEMGRLREACLLQTEV